MGLKRPCLTCGELSDDSYCPEHRKLDRERRRTSAWKGSSNWAWSRRRAEVLARDGQRCRRCGATEGLQVHHVRARALDGTDDPWNLVTLCGDCHPR